jgi:hypothetical protein
MRPHLVDRDLIYVCILDRLDQGRRMIGEVLELHDSTLALDEVNNCLSYPTFVKSILSFRNDFSESFS